MIYVLPYNKNSSYYMIMFYPIIRIVINNIILLPYNKNSNNNIILLPYNKNSK